MEQNIMEQFGLVDKVDTFDVMYNLVRMDIKSPVRERAIMYLIDYYSESNNLFIGFDMDYALRIMKLGSGGKVRDSSTGQLLNNVESYIDRYMDSVEEEFTKIREMLNKGDHE